MHVSFIMLLAAGAKLILLQLSMTIPDLFVIRPQEALCFNLYICAGYKAWQYFAIDYTYLITYYT